MWIARIVIRYTNEQINNTKFLFLSRVEKITSRSSLYILYPGQKFPKSFLEPINYLWRHETPLYNVVPK